VVRGRGLRRKGKRKDFSFEKKKDDYY